MAEQLLIGDVTALTGIAPGRIRHYEKIGLLRADHLSNGYRVFDVEQVLDLLRIDLLRSLGVSIKDIQRLAHQTALADVLEEHRASLVAQRDRLDRLIAAIDAATDIADADVNECILQRLATSHRHSIGVIGRLSAPLSPATAAMYADLFDKWQLPVPALFGQMVLPPAASTLLEELAETPGRDVLFARLRQLARDVVALGENNAAATELAQAWIEQQLADPLPDDVVAVLRGVQPLLEHDPVIVQGFRTWAASITPAAARFIDEMARETARRELETVSVIVLPPAPVEP
ncbi:MerR family transcriptional regulator [Mycobacterium xenopi]|uniref:HTH merR-type domain-containing protein n=1 Tax=Mycobacterium xenopi TaxID=1789 RepID=A0AAD1H0D4_MYCXE|nr:MerR family transcriptional regulator [Mycobacterium xenopi]EID13481.1 MerR family transcriptional regulator [Mycobacterium xenopi RIVM700367]MDA3638261.1 MerR family transcriptional regulator [Mycobacterium xenopi]MDA3656330.1 MerR family transcriptional regulator [Mycobacterium xenopi]MDA3661789.1 MerR family transcriptional regulator [Mycobacterium xenopi]ORX20142.1 MerR family transcriptional regulator [Mycobacterium xenopi]